MTLHIRAVLLDLDDTLLGNDINGFIAHYIPLLTSHMSPVIDGEIFIKALGYGTQAMIDDVDPATTNAEVFWNAFDKVGGVNHREISSVVDEFYGSEFRKLRSLTVPIPAARRLVDLCFKKGFKVVVATNPMFPLSAVQQRLEWADIPVDEFPFDLVTTYEIMHATKPRPEYYQEILTALGTSPGESLMVGDDWLNDIGGAANCGLHTYWIDLNRVQPEPEPPGLVGSGSLESFLSLIESGEIQPQR